MVFRQTRWVIATAAIAFSLITSSCGSDQPQEAIQPEPSSIVSSTVVTTSTSSLSVSTTIATTSTTSVSTSPSSDAPTTTTAKRHKATTTTSPIVTTPIPETTTTTTLPPLTGSITVLAASSLTNAMNGLKASFIYQHPDINITFSFGSSSSLKTNILNGSPGDVYASADWSNMAAVVDASKTSSTPSVFATNYLQIMVRPGNPLSITTLGDLARNDVSVATCTDGVPIRTYTDTILTRAGVAAHFVTYEANVGGIVTKVTTGAADAGIVYRTDVLAAGSSATGVRIPTTQNLIAEYPIAILQSSANPTVAQAFVDFIQSTEGQNILVSFGFGEG